MKFSHCKEDVGWAVGQTQMKYKVVAGDRFFGEHAISSLTSCLQLQSALETKCCQEFRVGCISEVVVCHFHPDPIFHAPVSEEEHFYPSSSLAEQTT